MVMSQKYATEKSTFDWENEQPEEYLGLVKEQGINQYAELPADLPGVDM